MVRKWDFSEAKSTRIIECRNQAQWIIQNRSGTRGGFPMWRPRSFCQTREALERLLPGMAGEIAAALPARFVTRRPCVTADHPELTSRNS